MKITTLGMIALSASAALAHELVDFSRPDHRWKAANHVENGRQTSSGYAFDVTGVDPWCVASATYRLPPPPANAAYLRIELETAPIANPRSFQIFWHEKTRHFNELESKRLEPVGSAPCTVFAANLPVGTVGTNELALRIDPPGKSESFARVEYRRLRASYIVAEWTPQFAAPPAVAFAAAPPRPRAHGRVRFCRQGQDVGGRLPERAVRCPGRAGKARDP